MLSIKNLSHTYANGVQALKNINLEISTGMFGLLGPNGAGKSTLMRTIAALQEPSSGSIHFGDIDIRNDPNRLRRTLGYLPQEFGVYPRGSAYEILDHLAAMKGFLNRKIRKQLVEDLLHQTNLYPSRTRRLSTYSGGMMRRFGIAQSLIGHPQLLIVDEPTAGLDPEERNRFYNLLAEIGEEVVVILSTHIVEDIAVLCPRMAVISDGEVVLQGIPADLMRNLEGKIWEKRIDRSALPEYEQKYETISTHFVAGQMAIRIKSVATPEDGFHLASANLEDVYFCAINSSQHNSFDHHSRDL